MFLGYYPFCSYTSNDHTLFTQHNMYRIEARPPEKYKTEQDLLYA